MPGSSDVKTFGDISVNLARNPLGIIALFIVLVYGFASFVIIFGSSLSPSEKLPLVYFLTFFPVLVLASFTWLVCNHSDKLFSPSDFRDEKNYMALQEKMRIQMRVATSLTAATAKGDAAVSEGQIERVIDAVQATGAARATTREAWKQQILWVDDLPANNTYERRAFEALGLSFTLAKSTEEALEELRTQRFAAIISDMGRKEGPREGYVLLDKLRKSGDQTPLFFYASSNAPEHKRETIEHGGQGCTNNAQELFEMVTKAVIQSR
jgi:CheY-like chemotaxis protein